MTKAAFGPVRLGRLRSLRVLPELVADPVAATQHLHSRFGSFVLLQNPFAGRTPFSGFVYAANSALYREMMSAADTWRGVPINFRGLRGSSTHRLSSSMPRMHGPQHAHYRSLVSIPLKRPAVASMSTRMAEIVESEVDAWPRDTRVDLVPLIERLMRVVTIGLLFGDDKDRALPIAHMIALQGDAARPFPGRDYFSWARVAGRQERAILAWAKDKQGAIDTRDIFSILVNSANEYGEKPDQHVIASLLSFTLGAAYETCMNGLIWTLVLLSQYPAVAAALADEINGALQGDTPTMERLSGLSLLDGVVRESHRLLPPVPLQVRKSLVATALGGVDVPQGTRVIISAYLINRNPELYPDPDRFIPERWTQIDPSPYEYTVFGAGGRMCPGSVFAMQVTKIALAAILSRYRVDTVANTVIDYRVRVTLAPYPSVPVVLRDVTAPPSGAPVSGTIHRLVDLPRGSVG